MIPRSRPPKPSVEDATPPGPSKMVELRDLDFDFGLNDSLAVTLTPEDSFQVETKRILLHFQNGEQVEIDRSRVRWWSLRKRTIAVPLDLLSSPVE